MTELNCLVHEKISRRFVESERKQDNYCGCDPSLEVLQQGQLANVTKHRLSSIANIRTSVLSVSLLAQAARRTHRANTYLPLSHLLFSNMAPMKAMKAMKSGAKAMSKGAIAEALAIGCELKKSVCARVLDVLAEVATQGVKKNGVFAVPGLCRLKIRNKPATKAGKREVFGKVVMVKAKPARKIVKAYPVAALKQSI